MNTGYSTPFTTITGFGGNFGASQFSPLNQKKKDESGLFPGLPQYMEKKILDYATQNSYNETQKNMLANDLYKEALKQKKERDMEKNRQEVIRESYARGSQQQDQNQKNQYNSTAKALEVVGMIRDYAKENGQDLSDLNDSELLQAFAQNNPETIDKINVYLQSDQSSVEFAQSMGFSTPLPASSEEEGGTDGNLRGMGARNGLDFGWGEWINPIGKITEMVDDWAQSIPTVDTSEREQAWRERIANVSPEERARYEKTFNNSEYLKGMYGTVDNYIAENKKGFRDHFWGVGDEGPNVAKMLLNSPGSLLKTATGTARGLTNPLDTVTGLLKLVGTEEGRTMLAKRYGSDFQKTLEEDPVGLASDILTLIQAGASLGSKGAQLAGKTGTATKLSAIAETAGGAADLGLGQAHAKMLGGFEKLGTVGKVLSATQAPLKTIVEVLPSAEHTLQNMNRLTKGEQANFQKMTGISQGKWMNERGMVAGGEKAVDMLADYFIKSKNKVDEAMALVQGEYKNDMLTLMAKESADFAENTFSDGASRMKELSIKAEETGLTMSEINEVKRFYEKNNKFTYGKDITAGEKSVRATNIDNAVREWQIKTAEENGFDNLREMNKETQASKYLLDKMVKNENGSFGNNFFTLTDYITSVGLGSIDVTMLTGLIGKKALTSNWFRTNYAKIINKINGHQTIAEKIADIEKIKNIQSKKDLEKFLNNDNIEKNQILDSNFNQDDLGNNYNHLMSNGISDGQTIGQQTSQIEGSLGKINEGISGRVGLKGNIERSEGKGLDKLREGAETKYQHIEGTQQYGIADSTEKTVGGKDATAIRNIRNGRSVAEISEAYGVKLEIVDKITTPQGVQAYGKYGDGIITLADQIKEGTAPHELFHATFDLVDTGRKEKILTQVMENKKVDRLQAEEYLADSFSEYFRKGSFDTRSFGKGVIESIKQYFYKVKNWITGVNAQKGQIKNLFDEILDGEIDRDMLGEILGNKKGTDTHRHQQSGPRLVSVPVKSSISITPENASIFTSKLNNLSKVIKNGNFGAGDFLDGLKNNLNIDKKSGYLISQKDGSTATLRISDHYANARNNKIRGYVENNTSIVIKLGNGKFKAKNGVDLIEFVYDPANLTPEKMQGIIKGIQDWIDTGNYTDKGYDHTHKSIRASLENGEVKYQIGDIDTKKQNTPPKSFGSFRDIDIYSKNEAFGRFVSPRLKEKTVSGISLHTQEKMMKLDQALRKYGHKGVTNKDFGASYMLPEVLDDPKLYEKYPQLKETQVIFADFHTTQKRGLQAGGSIFINSKLYEKDPRNLRSTIVHEIQHIKQDIKGMPKVYEDADIRKLDQRYMDDPREIDARRKQQEYLDFVDSQKKSGNSFEILQKEFPNVKEVGEGEFGKIYEGVKGSDAERLLIKQKGGEVRGAYNYKNEPVDLIWGKYDSSKKTGLGLAKIVKKHPEALGKIQGYLDNLPEAFRDKETIVLGNEYSIAVIKLQYHGENKKRIMTAYEKN